MKLSLVFSFAALSALCAQAKDGQWNPKHSTMVSAAPSAYTGTGVAAQKTYYSYSYKNPAVTPKRGTVSASDYAHKGATTIDSYKSSSIYPQISGGKWSASSTVNTAQSTATSKINSLKTSPAINAAANAAATTALQSALHQ